MDERGHFYLGMTVAMCDGSSLATCPKPESKMSKVAKTSKMSLDEFEGAVCRRVNITTLKASATCRNIVQDTSEPSPLVHLDTGCPHLPNSSTVPSIRCVLHVHSDFQSEHSRLFGTPFLRKGNTPRLMSPQLTLLSGGYGTDHLPSLDS